MTGELGLRQLKEMEATQVVVLWHWMDRVDGMMVTPNTNITQNQGALVKHEDHETDVLELEDGGAEAIKLRSSHSTLHAARLHGNIHM
ncbi:hypothetical protein E2562_013637 [Oryza meyeriana var. granulata]|uniref:Uncharacterized protein n=1 Tax=Oryza meyeriana var. granulata TaxID=110450 RepID=A0A6G1F7X1_9ORYZ|nr:hypothetical protein E2562_013637 [Oryza meyeriana var. granulata]